MRVERAWHGWREDEGAIFESLSVVAVTVLGCLGEEVDVLEGVPVIRAYEREEERNAGGGAFEDGEGACDVDNLLLLPEIHQGIDGRGERGVES